MQMLMTSPNYIPATRRMHVGKELEQFESLRFYDPLLVRFTTPDPLALSYPSLSPLLRKQPCMQRGFGWDNNGSKQRCCDANCYSRTSRKYYKQFKY